MTRKQRRLTLIGAAGLVLVVAAGLVLSALRDSIVFFNSPTDVIEKQVKPGSRIRLGGLVAPGSLVRGDNLAVRFQVTDGNSGCTCECSKEIPRLAPSSDSRRPRYG